MFNIGDYVVCPGHGVGQVSSLEKRFNGQSEEMFYYIKLLSNGMKVMMPVKPQNEGQGLRRLVGDQEIETIYNMLHDHNIKPDTSTWNRRHRDYLAKVKTGSLVEIADVLRELFILKYSKKLSFGEKKMMEQCKELIVQEIAISRGIKAQDVSIQIESIFTSPDSMA